MRGDNYSTVEELIGKGSDHERRISATPPPEGPGKRHKFEARVDYIKDRDGISRTQAMSRARAEFPQTYTSYQRHLASRTTRQQHMAAAGTRSAKARRPVTKTS
jgi:hypothetical protein